MTEIKQNRIIREEFERMPPEEKILTVAGGFVPPQGRPEEEILNSIFEKSGKEDKRRKIVTIKHYIQAIAAVFILLVALKIVPQFLSAQQVRTKNAEQKEVTLPDGTEVVLNAGSKIKWNKNKFNEKRYLTLKGEAFFDVKKGDEFIIKTPNGTVEILGTQLDILSRNNKFIVSCLRGKVRIIANNQQQVITPGELVKLNQDRLEKSYSETIGNTASWKEGICHFENTSLETIFEEIERQFNVSIIFEGNYKRKATVDFSNKNMSDALEVVCIPMGLKYEINNKKIIISEKE